MTDAQIVAIYDAHIRTGITLAESERNGAVVAVLLKLQLSVKREIVEQMAKERDEVKA